MQHRASPAGPHDRPLTRLAARPARAGVGPGQLIAWQVAAVLAVAAAVERGPERLALGGIALAGLALTSVRWRHRWAYQWLLATWQLHHSRRVPAAPRPGHGPSWAGLPAIAVTPARIRGGGEVGVAHDGDGFAAVIAVAPEPGAPPVTLLPLAALASLLDAADPVVSAVQVVVQADLAAGAPASAPAASYRNLGYHRVPRSESAWIVLRHDPAASRYAVGAAGPAKDVHNSLTRALAGRASRALDLIGGQHLSGRLLDTAGLREALAGALPGPAGPGTGDWGAGHHWGSWDHAGGRHITYWLRRWPPGGLPALEQALTDVPAVSVTCAVVLARGRDRRLRRTASVRVTVGPDADLRAAGRAAAEAAASCGARLVPLEGEHGPGVLATVPLGRRPAGRWLSGHADGPDGRSMTTVAPVAAGGVVLGAADPGPTGLLTVPLFSAAGASAVTVVGDQALPRLLALRALGSGARLQVLTRNTGGWRMLRDQAGVPPDRMAIARPGTAPPDGPGTPADPWVILDDTGTPAAGLGPWQAGVTVLGPDPAGAIPPGPTAIVLQRVSELGAAAVTAALGLPGSAAAVLQAIPDGTIALARPGAPLQFATLAPDAAERSMLAASLRHG
jgi:type VII secretion protein EccE